MIFDWEVIDNLKVQPISPVIFSSEAKNRFYEYWNIGSLPNRIYIIRIMIRS